MGHILPDPGYGQETDETGWALDRPDAAAGIVKVDILRKPIGREGSLAAGPGVAGATTTTLADQLRLPGTSPAPER